MPHTQARATLPRVQAREKAQEASATLGQKLILWGWLTSMLGVALYCKAIFSLGPDAGMGQAFLRAGVPGWAAMLFLPAGIVLWFVGNFTYLKEAMDRKED